MYSYMQSVERTHICVHVYIYIIVYTYYVNISIQMHKAHQWTYCFTCDTLNKNIYFLGVIPETLF